MLKKPKTWLDAKTPFGRQKPGQALAKWLNEADISQKFIEELLADAQYVFRWVAEYGSLHALNVAKKKKNLPQEFWDAHQKLNETLATFICAPQVDLDFLPDELLDWSVVAEEPPIARLSVQVRWVLALIEQRAILKVRRCKQCMAWFFARRSDQQFCKPWCQRKYFQSSEEFKAKRRKYMREYYKHVT